MPTSSFGCMIFDTLIAIWFFDGAPSILARASRQRAPEVSTPGPVQAKTAGSRS
jgi:hypothetical protein